jgi:hypothetical protein
MSPLQVKSWRGFFAFYNINFKIYMHNFIMYIKIYTFVYGSK